MSEWIDVKKRQPKWWKVVHVYSSDLGGFADAVYACDGNWLEAATAIAIPGVTRWLETEPDASADDKWISVEERLPIGDDSVLIGWASRKDVIVAYLCGGEWHPHWDTSLSLLKDPPTHWQPRPDPPAPEASPVFSVLEIFSCGIEARVAMRHSTDVKICEFPNYWTGKAACDKLNALWAADKGTAKEAPSGLKCPHCGKALRIERWVSYRPHLGSQMCPYCDKVMEIGLRLAKGENDA